MDTTLRPRLVTLPRQGRLLLVAGVLVALAALAIVAVGSQRSRSPEPFGLARNGAIVTSSDGDIFLIDPATSDSRLLIGGDGFDFGPVFSRDGTRMVFLRSDGPLEDPATLTMYVARPDGSDVRAVTPPTSRLDWYDWSPDGTRIAYVSEGDLWVVDIDGGGPRRLDDTGSTHFPTWLPPDGKEILYRRETASPGIFAISPDGSGGPRQLSKTPP
ncbi:MAG: DPP IV N-terminal domain-containing protein, partial [Candidatus Limnocylindrales bacterium]